MPNDDPPRAASLPPGYDENDPYEGVDLATYPEWWRQNAEEFLTYGMRPYRPSRLADGTVLQELITALESELEVEITVRVRNPQEGGRWYLVVDGERVRQLSYDRTGDGYTEYDLDASEFERLVREATEG